MLGPRWRRRATALAKDLARFPLGAAWIEMTHDDWVVALGLMTVSLNPEGTRYLGMLPLPSIGVSVFYAEGLRPEAWAVREENVDLIPLQIVERLLSSTALLAPSLRQQLGQLKEAIRRKMAGLP